MRKECVAEPSLNNVESGNAEKALVQVLFQQVHTRQKKKERTYFQLRMGIMAIAGICSLTRDLAQDQSQLKTQCMSTQGVRPDQQAPIANPKTQRRRRSTFSTSNEIPWRVGKIVVLRFGDLNGSVLVRDRPTLARDGSDGLIFTFKSGDEEATWWRSRVLLASI
jgi:hypothetical protein